VRKSKSRRFAWRGHVERTEENGLTEKIKEWKRIAFRLRERPIMKWEGFVKQVVIVMKIYHRKKQAKSRNK
jgi:hypothetical protein